MMKTIPDTSLMIKLTGIHFWNHLPLLLSLYLVNNDIYIFIYVYICKCIYISSDATLDYKKADII